MSYDEQLAHVCNELQMGRVGEFLKLGFIRRWQPFALQPSGWVTFEAAVYPDEPSVTVTVGVNGNVAREAADEMGGWLTEFYDVATGGWVVDDEIDFSDWLGVAS